MRTFIAVAAALALTASGVCAQQKAPAEAMFFAKKVASANTFEIQSSELAKDRAQSADVKSFADQMITDHTKAGEDFKAAVQQANVSPAPAEQPDAKHKATLTKLRNAQGAAFDKAYVNAQLTAHKEAVALFRTYSKSGRTAPLKEFATSTVPTLEHHLSMVQELSRSSTIAGKSSSEGSGGAAIGPPAGAPKTNTR
jgi:putative membrane protein